MGKPVASYLRLPLCLLSLLALASAASAQAPAAAFTSSPNVGFAPHVATFTDTSSGAVTAWAWTFGDGGTSTLQNPTHGYAAEGYYTVKLTVTGPGGSSSITKPRQIVVQKPPRPTAFFGAGPTSGFAPLVVNFSNLSSGTITTYAWSFGDGGTSALANPTHTYTTAGTYSVSLSVVGPGGGDSITATNLIVVEGAPVADFTGTPTSGIAPLNVAFSDASTGTASAWAWTFGDGGVASVQNPTHTYAAPGTYNVTLLAAGPGGSDVETKIGYVTVIDPLPVAGFSATPTSGDAPLAVAFSDLSTGNVSAWSWSFGDGGSSSLQNPSHTYATPGTYDVALTATGPGGMDTATQVGLILVQEPPPMADFVGAPLTGAAPLNVAFTDLTTNMVTTWAWSFGDGQASTLQNPSHTYAAAGTYTVILSVVGPGGLGQETKTDYVVVDEPPPVADFTGTPLAGIAPLNVAFSDSSVGVVTGWAWTFGDGGTSSLQDPTHTYAAAGTYTVSLTSSGPGGSDSITKNNYVTVSNSAPVADFSATPLTGGFPLLVNFTDLSTGLVSSWSWTFGDGGSSTLQNPSHTYTAAGAYTVSLTAASSGGSDVETKAAYVVVSNGVLVSNFTATPVSGLAPLNVSFTDQSTGTITGWAWNFGDGGASTLQNPTHTFNSVGNYSVSLAVFGPGGLDLETKPSYIQVTNPPPLANFAGTPTEGAAPLTVSFADLSGGAVTAWSWSFGDGQTSALQHPVHVYASKGTYDVTLTATGPAGMDSLTRLAYVVVTRPFAETDDPTETVTPPEEADFFARVQSGSAPLTVDFVDVSRGNWTRSIWSFGDGTGSPLKHPTHTYNTAGTYTVSLERRRAGGSITDVETKAGYIVVTNAPPVAEFSGSPLAGAAPLAVAFTDLSTGTVTARSWNFGDGGSSSAKNPAHEYMSAGTYTVTLTATGPLGSDVETKASYVVVSPSLVPVAGFSGAPLAGVAPLNVAFSDQSTGAVTAWSWSFGDGGTSSLQNPTHTFGLAGTYTVSLTAAGPGGSDVATVVDYVTVSSATPPVSDFAGSPTSGFHPLTVAFTDLSTGTITTHAWSFGDGGVSNLADPTHVYSNAGTYTVSLSVIGPGGSDNETRVGYVVVLENNTEAAQPTTTVTPADEADFFSAVRSGTAPLTVDFVNVSRGVWRRSIWDFGDGTGSILRHPTKTFINPGTYTVSLEVRRSNGAVTDTETKLGYITVAAPLIELEGGSFEAEVPGGLPGGAWRPTSGQGDARVENQPTLGMPSHGSNFVTLGGARGPAGIEQSFGFDPNVPHLAFEAALRRGSSQGSLVVEVGDGFRWATVLRREESFSTETLHADLREHFHNLELGSPLTLRAVVEGVDTLAALDGFRLLAAASATPRGNTSASCYLASLPTLGAPFEVTLSAPGASLGLVLGFARPQNGIHVGGLGELLVDFASAPVFQLGGNLTNGSGHFVANLPADPALAGRMAFTQAFLGGASGMRACNAIDLILGF